MKILEISDRGIKLLEDGDIINQIIFYKNEDIPSEVKELLSIYETKDVVNLKILIDLDQHLVNEIKDVIKYTGWKLKASKEITKLSKYILTLIVLIQLFVGAFIFFKISELEKQLLNLSKENIQKKNILKKSNKNLVKSTEEIIEIINFKKSKINNILIFFSEVSKQSEVKFQKIEFLENKIKINGSGKELKNISEFRKYILSNPKIKKSIFDFIKKEGDRLYFLIELEM
ncbi:MAG: hypothetical protein ACRCZR_03645 [Cetobacterium sp.]